MIPIDRESVFLGAIVGALAGLVFGFFLSWAVRAPCYPCPPCPDTDTAWKITANAAIDRAELCCDYYLQCATTNHAERKD